MSKLRFYGRLAATVSCAALFTVAAQAEEFNVPAGDLKVALDTYARQSGIALLFSTQTIKGVRTGGVKGNLPANDALEKILAGTGLSAYHDPDGSIGISKRYSINAIERPALRLAAAASSAGVETVVVTSSKIKGDIQTVPIAITALSQEQLTSRQIAGGPDLVKEVPNLTFTKTNFTGYSIEIRGIGTQAISVTTDPAVAVAFNDTPFIRNHFFEQEFYDVSQVEVLRGPQGTLYGRNATAGVVNVVSAKPTDRYEAMGSVDVGNYNNRRLEGMINIPVIGDKFDVRVAGEWTKRDGYAFNEETGHSIDGRDLWSGRVSVLVHPIESLTANLVWEHFNEDDDRARSTKQLCTTDPGKSSIDGPAGLISNIDRSGRGFTSQGCLPGSLYAPTAFEAPNGASLPFFEVLGAFTRYPVGSNGNGNFIDPYVGLVQSRDLRVVDSQLDPKYRAKNDTFELNADYAVTPLLTLTSQTAYAKDFLYSTEDFNRFNSASGLWQDVAGSSPSEPGTWVGHDGIFCDPQLGCSNRLVAQDVSQEHAWQFNQEIRLTSNSNGPLNYSIGANYLHYQTLEDYYVFINALSLFLQDWNESGFTFGGTSQPVGDPADANHIPFDGTVANSCGPTPANVANHSGFAQSGLGCIWVDPNPLSRIDGQGHNYFRSQNPYVLNSYAEFGEVYYQVTHDLKFTGGLRLTDDRKHFVVIPSWTAVMGKGYPITGIVDQEWRELTGRFNATWTPKLDFTDQSLFYASYSHGYKGGGANPPGTISLGEESSPSNDTHPITFKPEFINAYEIGTKNTLLDGAMTLNGDVFYYNYRNYQISQIVDRTSVNLNFDANVKGAEIESTWEPVPGLRFNFAGGYENATLAKGSEAIDLMDRTAGHAGWMVIKPFVTQTSNCVMPTAVMNELFWQVRQYTGGTLSSPGSADYDFKILTTCAIYDSFNLVRHLDPVTLRPYTAYPDPVNYPGYAGFDPETAPNNGQGFAKDLSGNQLPNAPHFTVSLGGQYTIPLSEDWAGTARADFYWQSQSWARVFNDNPYDKLRGYSTTNLALIFTNSDGWQVMGYVKNVFNKTAITGSFLNSDDTALTTNVFVTDPRLIGMRITKNF